MSPSTLPRQILSPVNKGIEPIDIFRASRPVDKGVEPIDIARASSPVDKIIEPS